LDKVLEDRKNQAPKREMYQEEKDKIDNWKNDIKIQDKQLEDVAVDVKKMKLNVKDIEKGIDKIGRNIDKTNNMAGKSQTALEKSNKKLKEILEKVGGPANFCVDIVLICVCLGLIAVLYNLIKNQTGKSSATAATTLRILGSFD
jgi:small-conductance mechanosensitive channel